MRLLDVHQLKVESFIDSNLPSYAILSHTWGDGEVTHQDIGTSAAISMAGYAKVKKCCEVAIQDGFRYVWMDTCCIDKTSSSELSEAINSMYQWYKSAAVCYVYLSDVQAGDDPSDPDSSFSKSRWFTRGWTLQELIAPSSVVFYDSRWTEIGTKYDLQENVSRITRIPCDGLAFQNMNQFSVAERMSWAALRETTRIEDIAYCLMGIFDVNMPTLYGEGQKAFSRLQQEIMNRTDDHSLFVWVNPYSETPPIDYGWCTTEEGQIFPTTSIGYLANFGTGLLASSPRQFQDVRGVLRLEGASTKHPHSLTNKGLHIWLPVVRLPYKDDDFEIYQAILNCEFVGGMGPLSIFLARNKSGKYRRILLDTVRNAHGVKYDPEPVELYVEAISSSLEKREGREIRIMSHFVDNPSFEEGYTLLNYGPKVPWDQDTRTFQVDLGPNSMQLSYIIVGRNNNLEDRTFVLLGFVTGGDKPRLLCGLGDVEDWRRNLAYVAETAFAKTVGTLESDRVSEQLPSGDTISIAIRRGPQNLVTDTLGGPQIIQNFRVSITFTPPSLLSRGLVNLRPRPARPLPKLTITIHALLDRVEFVPEGDLLWSHRERGMVQTMVWTPTEEDMSAALAIFIGEKVAYPLLKFDILDSEIVLELVNNLPNSGIWGYSPSTVMKSYIDKTNPRDLGNRRRYRFPTDFPVEVEMDGRTTRIELTNQRIELNDVASYQMLFKAYPLPTLEMWQSLPGNCPPMET
ncbi:hypothetical protein GALMADRAFT_245882 [Galerina marginata CBS 339.88]|uniref:Uncharacterized protein n=1 Tax=Galerina marginata (strain CBS 339.88) TaxID=685588 RepID=A0A067T3L5_GALM3|nr:hypothetical protein GALMADRAFT_245882 [Galerina marginata CBS 339.88]